MLKERDLDEVGKGAARDKELINSEIEGESVVVTRHGKGSVAVS
jgi:hypothetical protein